MTSILIQLLQWAKKVKQLKLEKANYENIIFFGFLNNLKLKQKNGLVQQKLNYSWLSFQREKYQPILFCFSL